MTLSIKGISREIFPYMVAGGVGWSPMRAKKKKSTPGKKFISGSPLICCFADVEINDEGVKEALI